MMTATRSPSHRQEELPLCAGNHLPGDVRPAASLPLQRLSRHRTTAARGIPAVRLANPRRVRLIDLRDGSEVD